MISVMTSILVLFNPYWLSITTTLSKSLWVNKVASLRCYKTKSIQTTEWILLHAYSEDKENSILISLNLKGI